MVLQQVIMFCNRQKNSFKKKTEKVQHGAASKSILAMIRQRTQTPIHHPPIKQNNTPKKIHEHLPIKSSPQNPSLLKEQPPSPTFPQKELPSFSFNHQYELSFSNCQPSTNNTSNYVGFCHRAHEVNLRLSLQLMQTKKIIQNIGGYDDRIRLINQTLAETASSIQNYHQVLENNPNYTNLLKENNNPDKPPSNPHEIKLLRHEINRLFMDNEAMLKKIKDMQSNQQEIQSYKHELQLEKIHQHQSRSQIAQYEQQKNEYEEKMNQYEDKIIEYEKNNVETTQRIHEISEQNYKLQVEKECLLDFLDEEKNKLENQLEQVKTLQKQSEELKKHIYYQSKLQKENEVLTNEIIALKNNQKNQSDLKFQIDQEKYPTTTEELLRALQPYPKYFNLITFIISQYQRKISNLQTQICEQKCYKEKVIEWSHNISKKVLGSGDVDELMDDLLNLQIKEEKSNIQNLLRQIRALSIGIDENEILEMEEQLRQYIISLKARNQVIKEVEQEDGSSIMSETFTDHD